jgi:hypothetical protein
MPGIANIDSSEPPMGPQAVVAARLSAAITELCLLLPTL